MGETGTYILFVTFIQLTTFFFPFDSNFVNFFFVSCINNKDSSLKSKQ